MSHTTRTRGFSSSRLLLVCLLPVVLLSGFAAPALALIDDLQSMLVGRQGLGGAIDTSGFVYALGGRGTGLSPLYSSVERWDPTANAWSYISPMSTGRAWLGCTFGGDGLLYAFGGDTPAAQSSAEVYTPSTGSWATIAGLPQALSGLGAARDSLGRVYAFGGFTAYPQTTSAAYRYEPSLNQWTSVASMNVDRARFATATDSQGRIYAIGGGMTQGATTTVERYDPQTNTWSFVAPLPSVRDGAAAAYGGDNAIYTFGGWTGSGFTNDILRYDIAGNAWSSVGQMSVAKNNLAAVPSPDGNVYFFGGEGPAVHQSQAPMQMLVVTQPKTHVLCVGVQDVDAISRPLRGDATAGLVRDAFNRFRSVASCDLLTLRSDVGGTDNYDAVVSAVELARARVKPGDTFVMYVASHGYQPENGDEASVNAQYDGAHPSLRRPTTGDDYVWLSTAGKDLSDDNMRAIFDDTYWNSVNKLFIVDSCYSGGFWGTTGTGDTGDLATLPKTALIAAASEADFATCHWKFPSGYLNDLGVALADALDELSPVQAVQFATLAERIRLKGKQFEGVDGYITEATGLDDYWGQAAVSAVPGVAEFATGDFELTLGVPEPATLLLLALGGLAVLRRRRR